MSRTPPPGPMALARGRRAETWAAIEGPWDLVVVGGGITGAGILRASARAGLRSLLVERDDFASGTSSRSSKLVHGGLRYLASGQPKLTYESVRERERLVRALPGLVERVGFLLPTYRGDHPGRLTYEAGLTAYDLLSGGRTHHRYLRRDEFELLAPHVARAGLQGGFRFEDALTDDARLTLRVILEAVAAGAEAINYVRADRVLQDTAGSVVGVGVTDRETGRTADVRAAVVVNATGAWADVLRGDLDRPTRVRPLRGSHLVFPAWRLPAAQTISFLHPVDRRPVFVIPWEGATIYGTTDVDTPLGPDPAISRDELDYLMAGLDAVFPSLGLRADEAIATFAGVRPVIGTGKADPSAESRDHVVWDDGGLITVTGGKLTTFELIARDALRTIAGRLSGRRSTLRPSPNTLPRLDGEDSRPSAPAARPGERRLFGRHGSNAASIVACADAGELEAVPGTASTWAELRWAARAEAVVHLDDLLLRRVRIGLLLPDAAAAVLGRVRSIAQPELDWTDEQWTAEVARYLDLHRRQHAVPGASIAEPAPREDEHGR